MSKKASDQKPRRRAASVSLSAVEETLRLYDGWLAYLLTRLGENTLRVEAAALSEALRTLHCRVERDGSGYVIHLGERARGEEAHE